MRTDRKEDVRNGTPSEEEAIKTKGRFMDTSKEDVWLMGVTNAIQMTD